MVGGIISSGIDQKYFKKMGIVPGTVETSHPPCKAIDPIYFRKMENRGILGRRLQIDLPVILQDRLANLSYQDIATKHKVVERYRSSSDIVLMDGECLTNGDAVAAVGHALQGCSGRGGDYPGLLSQGR